jgi:hypothetical protein
MTVREICRRYSAKNITGPGSSLRAGRSAFALFHRLSFSGCLLLLLTATAAMWMLCGYLRAQNACNRRCNRYR